MTPVELIFQSLENNTLIDFLLMMKTSKTKLLELEKLREEKFKEEGRIDGLNLAKKRLQS